MKRGMFLAMLGLLVIGWLVTIQKLTELPSNVRRLVAQAEKYEQEKLFIRAIDSYTEALEYHPDSIDIQTRIARNYLAVGDEAAFISRCSEISDAYGYPISVVELLADFYTENQRYEKAIELLQKAMKKHKNEDALLSRYEAVRYTFQNLYVSADEIGQMVNDSAAFALEGRYGILTSSGSIRIRSANEWCGPYSSDGRLAPVQRDGEYFFADRSGYRYEIPEEGDYVDSLGILTNNVAPACINGKYGYVDSAFQRLSPFEWEGATQIQDGLGAVRQGERWALINRSYELLSDYMYEDAKMDENGFFCVANRAFVKSEGTYQMINEKGETVGEGRYEDAVPFVGDQPAAVQMGGKWGFVNRDGEMIIEPQYQKAGSFSNNLAPVETEDGWGYINLENKLVIEAQFAGAKSFYKGVAPVKDGNQWTLIELNVK